MIIRIFLLLVCLYSLPYAAISQGSSKISGYVKDSGGPVSDASVLIKGTTQGTVTDEKGYFEINVPKAAKITLVVSYTGYQSQEITVNATQHAKLEFLLVKDGGQLKDVQVIAVNKAKEVKASGFSVNVVETKQFANTTADINQVLNLTTGVRVREQGGLGSNFNFSINGLSGKQVRFFLDGIPMESFGGGMSLNNIPVNLAERIEVYKGVVPIELGSDALGGAVNVITDQQTKKFLDASLSYGSFNTSRAAVSGRLTDNRTGLVFNVSGYHNYSDNNYLMRNNPKNDAAIKVVENNQFVYKDMRRFHDAYRSSMGQVEVGLNNKSWADKISLGFTYSNLYNELQTGASQNNVYGAAYQKGNFYMTSLKYKKTDFLLKDLTANIAANVSIDRSDVVDTSSYVYGWAGIIRSETIAGELRDVKTLTHWKNVAAIARTNFTYKINDNQNLNLSYTFNRLTRSSKEELRPKEQNPFYQPNYFTKNVVGLAYQHNSFASRFTNTLFAKYFGLNILAREVVFVTQQEPYRRRDTTSHKGYWGYGLASRYKLTENAGVKLSIEHAYRLQEQEEFFGDGISVAANIKLQPEESDNINLGAYYAHQPGKHRFSAEAGIFYRNVKNLIFSTPGGRFSTYSNVGIARVTGLEGELGYRYNKLLDFTVNASYQNAINNREINPLTGMEDPVYGDRIPNQPWFFGNARLGVGQDNLIGKNTRLQLNYSVNYIHWFYISWESLGSRESKNKIPAQLIHNVSLSYSLKNGRYNISVESFNITNELAYDNFRLQKPGRSVFFKLRYFIK
ncbi:carboxypeptidase-like regulatory domain-containing protein [Agriterribacter sp.]|uniref:TonB-dependent receptor n=1 Tax=Agriterribacter sp. TaxID=2821509 RepID=UPI002C8D43E3|nr:carboxypeptidase-like regulatory domain-containing protein [Agriterribacter sp.]HRO47208.1 carboxypeptidase-like regulatory domain-containing protein [Agriterribacter sp.]HRQ18434.1 carboxypeptidase-like regulatory domain-containing protein [Agriterribacter sp.]